MRHTLIALACAALVGCTGGHASGRHVLACASTKGCSAGHANAIPEKNGHPDPAAVAARFGCTQVEPDDKRPELYAAAEVSCRYRGRRTPVVVFATRQSMPRWEALAREVGAEVGDMVVGDRFAVEAVDANAAAVIAARLDARTF